MKKNEYPSVLRRFNGTLWQLLITPLALLCYRPMNEYIFLPKFGSGKPYVDMQGELVTDYFSANTLAQWVSALLFVLTVILSVRNTRTLHGWKRAGVLFVCTAVGLVSSVLFLDYTLWG